MKNAIFAAVAALGLMTCLQARAFEVSNAQISDDSGHPIALNAVAWFGADNAAYVVSGLWSRNWQDMINQMKSNGVNAVRLPLCPATIHGTTVSSVSYSHNPDLQGLNSQQVLDKIVAGLDAAGIYILFDFHDTTCSNTLDPLWYTSSYSESQWISDLTFVAQRYAKVPHALGWDIKNEPHGTATWGTGNTSTDWNSAAERAGAALLQANPEWLVFVEGIQDNPKDLCQNDPSTIQHFWGENLEPFRCYPLNIPKNKLVLAPHVYGPKTYPQAYFSAANFPNNMPAIYDTIFGYLHDGGYAVAPTEWGGQYHEGYPNEDAFEDNFVAYLSSKGMTGAFYWAFNGNGWPKGGLLETDWSTINPAKETLLKTLWGAAPTSTGSTTPTSSSGVTPSSTPTGTGSTTGSTGTGGTSGGSTSGTPSGGTTSGSGTTSTPTSSPTPATKTTPPPAPTATLRASPTTVLPGASVTLAWSSTNATSCASSGSGWAAASLAVSGSKAIAAPATAGTYTPVLTCSGSGGSVRVSASFVVQPPPPPPPPAPLISMSLQPASIAIGQSSVVTWSTSNATACTSTGTGWPSGVKLATAGNTYTPVEYSAGKYTVGMTCTGAGGSVSASATLNVKAPAPKVHIQVNPSSAGIMQNATITWSTTNATSCVTAGNGWSDGVSMPLSGNSTFNTGLNTGSFTFELDCTGPGGAGSDATTMNVNLL